MTNDELVAAAQEARKNAYAPYSKFQVGAALLCGNGRIYTGANIENASYGLTVCAERVAVFKAVSSGDTDFEAIALAGSGTGFIHPCGACLQVLAEFNPGIKVIITDENRRHKAYNLHEMLPMLFTMGN